MGRNLQGKTSKKAYRARRKAMSIKWTDEAVKNWIDDNVAKDCFVGMERVTFDNGTRKYTPWNPDGTRQCHVVYAKSYDEWEKKWEEMSAKLKEEEGSIIDTP